MFEQHDRWLEELLEFTNRKESVTCTSGHMPLTAIAQEIETACTDARQHGWRQAPDWQSRADDLADRRSVPSAGTERSARSPRPVELDPSYLDTVF